MTCRRSETRPVFLLASLQLTWTCLQGVAFFSAVDIDHVMRKEVDLSCITPSHPGTDEKHLTRLSAQLTVPPTAEPIPPGVSVDVFAVSAPGRAFKTQCSLLAVFRRARLVGGRFKPPFGDDTRIYWRLWLRLNLHLYFHDETAALSCTCS